MRMLHFKAPLRRQRTRTQNDENQTLDSEDPGAPGLRIEPISEEANTPEVVGGSQSEAVSAASSTQCVPGVTGGATPCEGDADLMVSSLEEDEVLTNPSLKPTIRVPNTSGSP